jgi:hypothetical protein
MSKEDWRSPGAYTYTSKLEAGGLAWEFLRRNRDYRREHITAATRGDAATDAAAQHWGLRFPC